MRSLALIVGLLLAACSGARDDEAAEEAKYQSELAAATEEARARLPWFWEHFEAPEIDEYDFSLKVAVPRRDGEKGNEDVWVENLARGDDKLVGELMVDPQFLGDLKEGAIIEFTEKDVVDWAFLRGEELIGHYTTRVSLPRMDPVQAEGLRSMFGENPT
jgi:uncharacterized protein YegJ (DUF2314 family)